MRQSSSESAPATAAVADLRERFRTLHVDGTFVMPNAWDVGSALVLQDVGFAAVATTSSGYGESRGRADLTITLDDLLVHVEALTAAISIPLSVDSERLFGEDLASVAKAVDLLAAAGAAGCSIEDWDPSLGALDEVSAATDRVAAAAEAAHRHGMVLTARAERHLYDPEADLDETIARLRAYQAAGADCVYAPGILAAEDIGRVVSETGAAVNVLARQGVPAVGELAELGVRRISTGGALAHHFYGLLRGVAGELCTTGTYPHLRG